MRSGQELARGGEGERGDCAGGGREAEAVHQVACERGKIAIETLPIKKNNFYKLLKVFLSPVGTSQTLTVLSSEAETTHRESPLKHRSVTWSRWASSKRRTT